ncbi:hypothetical protein [Gandjariella thermophila]|uniref:Uncharacterized protein n=1 Tax=Gandjariella thermophila TaxID=1931992 RepID=A0A4D4JHA7_9PSEU|nr:hypothetical protein [Gandjariella thermophila]GDY33277.1 hypothetical protein GTS_49100 [Gandjariella thermophila]
MSTYRQEGEDITVHLPDQLPVLTPDVARILLAILVELAESKGRRPSGEGERRDC